MAIDPHKFDDIPGSATTPELYPVPTPYRGLAWPTFNVFQDTVAVIKAHSGTQFAASFLAANLGKTPMISASYAESKTKYFSLASTYFACVLSSGTGSVPEACTLTFTGTKVKGAGPPSQRIVRVRWHALKPPQWCSAPSRGPFRNW